MRNKKVVISLLIVLLLVILIKSQYQKLYIATGYGAKCMASGVFVAGRDPMNVKLLDLNYSLVQYTKSKIDYDTKTVSTTILGLAESKAAFQNELGCALIPDGKKIDDSLQFFNQLSYSRFINLPWPLGDESERTAFQNIDSLQLVNAVKESFDKSGEFKKQTASILVLYKGKIVAEEYWNDMNIDKNTRLWGWSMNKSISNALIGILAKEGKLSIDASAPVKEWLNDNRSEITIKNLLQMNSGLKWDEDYGDVSDATTMLYRESDCYTYAIQAKPEAKPGTKWKYSSGTPNILAGIIRSQFNSENEYHRFPYENLFARIGMTSMIQETDAAGNFVFSSYGYATTRDWARFGLLYYNNGVMEGDTLFNDDWVKLTREVANGSDGEYGAQFWLNKSRKMADAPEDTYFCQGHRGQRIFIIPSRELVIVRLGFSEKEFDFNKLIQSIVNSIH